VILFCRMKKRTYVFFSLYSCFRKFPDGGSGTTGFAHWHGQCMGSSWHNTETCKTPSQSLAKSILRRLVTM
jgi:hypothetical protein